MNRLIMKNFVILVLLMVAALSLIIVPVAAADRHIDLGLASNYAILAKSGISTTGTTSITGNMGASPIAASSITGFGLIMDRSNQFSTSSLVVGRIYAADYASPTSALLTTAINNMETAYTDAAGRVPPDATELYAGNLGEKTLFPGTYKWSTGVLIPTSTDLTLDAQGNANAVWIFQVAGDLTMDSASHVVLINGAKAENIYWQIAGPTGVTLGPGTHIEGNILAQKAITLKSGASIHGRALAQTAVTLIANTITIPTTTPVMIVPGGIGIPTSTRQNGRCDDVNGNGALDFNDVVLYFNQMDWIASNEPVAAFDFNKNGQIDFNDIVILFNEM